MVWKEIIFIFFSLFILVVVLSDKNMYIQGYLIHLNRKERRSLQKEYNINVSDCFNSVLLNKWG